MHLKFTFQVLYILKRPTLLQRIMGLMLPLQLFKFEFKTSNFFFNDNKETIYLTNSRCIYPPNWVWVSQNIFRN